MRNYWTENASALARAYLSDSGTIALALATRGVACHAPTAPARALDIGGGDGRQAIELASLGYDVTVLDIDPVMLGAAASRIGALPDAIRSRIELRNGEGTRAFEIIGGGFDIVCAHSVLMYLEDPRPLMKALVMCAARGGLISIVSLNTDAIALRSGLQGRWREAVECLERGGQAGERYLPTTEMPRSRMEAELRELGADILAWHGIGVFTDHLAGPIRTEQPLDVIDAEWLAGRQDPYRGVGRCFQLLARRL